MSAESDAERRYRVGNEYPYDDGREAVDWAHKAARGILSDLCDRRGIKWEFEKVADDDTKCDIVDSMAAIIRHSVASVEPFEPLVDEFETAVLNAGHNTLGRISAARAALMVAYQKRMAGS